MSKLKRMKDVTVGVVLGGVLFSGVSYAASTSIDVSFQPLKYFFDGVEKKAPADQQGFMYKGTTYVPLRFVSESLGKKVGYEGKTSSIYVGKQPEGQKTFLDDLTPISTQYGDKGTFVTDGDFKSNTGAAYTHSVSLHTNGGYAGEVSYEFLLNGDYNKFEALLAPSEDWSKSFNENIGLLKIYADDTLVYESGQIASNITAPVKVDVDVKGALKIKVELTSNNLGLLNAGFIS
ncbi:hypothetical protein J19TS2_17310 [Cohnella xylanilytica]|uniref:stalk domain-containing protein n=1 Tax=Cohnella xylanilytica TaxID=557555 RepID=UPI001B254723|nr:stalk domain-containing protein [Cohnella xylanilytica]GIO12176.1 hypothetical protein J19TS2_17310 [Cohnella xylanilytica]